MHSYERVLCAVGHERPDRPPMELLATPEVVASLREHGSYRDDEQLLASLGIDFRSFLLNIAKRQPIPEEVERSFGHKGTLSATPYGVVLLQHPQFPQAHRVHGPFYDNEDLDAFNWPDASSIEDSETVQEGISRCNLAGACSLVRCDNPFKIAYFMRRFEDFMVDCLRNPDFVLELLRRIARVEFKRAERGVKAGARCAMVFGDFADQRSLMISPESFRKTLKPVLTDLVERLKAINNDVLVFLHSDGNLIEVLADLIDCGFDAVHPIQPECMDMREVKKRYGKRLTLFGGVSVQTELPYADVPAIRRIVRDRIDSLGRDGGFMLAPSNTILPDVPDDRVFAMYEEGSKP